MGSAFAKRDAKSGLCVRRQVTNGHDIIAWGKSQGFKQMVQPGDMHVTLAHSTEPVDKAAAGDAAPAITAQGGERRVAALGDKGAIVLHFADPSIEGRHKQLTDAGAKWDFPSFQPHVTLTYSGDGIDPTAISPYSGPIDFGPEIHEPLNDGWSDGIVEKAQFRISKIDEDSGLVYGWAIVCEKNGEPYYDLNIDKNEDGSLGERMPEHIPPATMIKAALEFAMTADRPGNEMHKGPQVGSFPFLMPMTKEIAKGFGIACDTTGLMVAYKPTPDVLQKFKDNIYTGFSIEGSRLAFEEHD
jgi:hypothetical protein